MPLFTSSPYSPIEAAVPRRSRKARRLGSSGQRFGAPPGWRVLEPAGMTGLVSQDAWLVDRPHGDTSATAPTYGAHRHPRRQEPVVDPAWLVAVRSTRVRHPRMQSIPLGAAARCRECRVLQMVGQRQRSCGPERAVDSTGNKVSAVPDMAWRSISVGAAIVKFGALGAMLAGPLYEIITPARRSVWRSVTPTSAIDSRASDPEWTRAINRNVPIISLAGMMKLSVPPSCLAFPRSSSRGMRAPRSRKTGQG